MAAVAPEVSVIGATSLGGALTVPHCERRARRAEHDRRRETLVEDGCAGGGRRGRSGGRRPVGPRTAAPRSAEIAFIRSRFFWTRNR